MGRNGAGKSTLLRHAAGLLEPTRGRIERAGRVALLLQNPGDYLLHERVGEEASAATLAARRPRQSSQSAIRATSQAASASAWRSQSSPATGARRPAARPPCWRSMSPRAAWTARPRPRSRPTSDRAPSPVRR